MTNRQTKSARSYRVAYVLSAGTLIMLCSCQGVPKNQFESAQATEKNQRFAEVEKDFELPREKSVVRSQSPDADKPAARNSKVQPNTSRVITASQKLSGSSGGPAGQPVPPQHYPRLPYHAIYHPPLPQDGQWMPPGLRGPWPRDEYLFDGGDQDVPVEVGADFTVGGLDLEDTIGHFDTLDGRTIVSPSNRVPIYAPRFAAVRKVYGFVQHEGHQKSAGVEMPTRLLLHEDVEIATTSLQQIQPQGKNGTKSSSTFRERTRGINISSRRIVRGLDNGFLPYEDFRVIRHGQYDNSEKARLSRNIDAAIVWSHKQAVQVTIDGIEAAEHRGTARTDEAILYERPDGKPALRVVKVASTSDAKPGDEIDFTIRFDNVGTEKIGNVTIIDNLTTRLEYILDTAQCSLGANFFTIENEGDSLILRWEIIEPMKTGDGGIIRFKCRVR